MLVYVTKISVLRHALTNKPVNEREEERVQGVAYTGLSHFGSQAQSTLGSGDRKLSAS